MMDATGADPDSLRRGPGATALDLGGRKYSRKSFHFFQKAGPLPEKELKFYLYKIINYLELVLIASNRVNRFKAEAVNSALINAISKIAEDFGLVQSIHNFLVEKGSVQKKTYRVSDLRKFPDYAKILGFKDNKRFKPDKLVPFVVPYGWIRHYIAHETAILPPDEDMKLPDNRDYILDDERPIPQFLKEIMSQALYWKIKSFRLRP